VCHNSIPKVIVDVPLAYIEPLKPLAIVPAAPPTIMPFGFRVSADILDIVWSAPPVLKNNDPVYETVGSALIVTGVGNKNLYLFDDIEGPEAMVSESAMVNEI
jgi:hypothetical protein